MPPTSAPIVEFRGPYALAVASVTMVLAACAAPGGTGPRDTPTAASATSTTSAASTAPSTAAPWGDPRSLAARVELHPIRALTLSDAQFLTGDAAGGRETVVSGELRVAQGTGRLPVVVLVHGSGGIGPNVEAWARDFNARGISTFSLDGFTGRGIVATSTDQKQLGRLNLTLDAYRALEILARHPRVDPERIVPMGFSRGGQATLYASLARFHGLWNRSGIGFAAYVPFYPDCMTRYETDTRLVDRPVRIFHGVPDDYNPLANCKAYVQRLRADGRDVPISEYPGGHHGFDNPLAAAGATVARDSQTVRRCRIRETAPGRLTNEDTSQPFRYDDACVERNPHVGHDRQDTLAAHRDVLDFLRPVLQR